LIRRFVLLCEVICKSRLARMSAQMQILLTLTLVVQILSALVMIVLVLMQHGKGADMGASFGSGASGSLFGATGSANFLSRSTAVAATLFFVTTLMMAYFGNRANSGDGWTDGKTRCARARGLGCGARETSGPDQRNSWGAGRGEQGFASHRAAQNSRVCGVRESVNSRVMRHRPSTMVHCSKHRLCDLSI
jgi:protein translocase subunit secG